MYSDPRQNVTDNGETQTKLTFDISILDRMLNLGQRSHRPRSHTSANLDLACTLKLEIVQFSISEVGSWEQEWESPFVVLMSAYPAGPPHLLCEGTEQATPDEARSRYPPLSG